MKASFVNVEWALEACEQELMNELKYQESIGGAVSHIAQAEFRGFLRAVGRFKEILADSANCDRATITGDLLFDEGRGELTILNGTMRVSFADDSADNTSYCDIPQIL